MANMNLKKTAMPEQDAGERAANFSEVALGYEEAMALEEAARCLECKHRPCVAGCPVNVQIPEFIGLVKRGDFLGAYAEAGWRPLLLANAISICWGVANVLFGVCVLRIGAALTGAILSGVAVATGVTLPMIVKGSGQFSESPGLTSPAGIAILAGVAVMITGVALCAVAGFGRDKVLATVDRAARPASGGFLGGLIMSVIAGVTSTGISLSFVYAQKPILDAVTSRGADPIPANVAVWAAILFGGACVNLAYPAWLMTKNRSWNMLAASWLALSNSRS